MRVDKIPTGELIELIKDILEELELRFMQTAGEAETEVEPDGKHNTLYRQDI